MLDFLMELEKVLKIWPDNVKWSIVQISDKTKTKIPHVVDYLSDALSKSLDMHDPMTFNEINKALRFCATAIVQKLKPVAKESVKR